MSLVLDKPVGFQPRIVRLPLPRGDNRVGMWHAPAVIAENNFVYKSLSNWAFNVAVGCSHACRFCYVPSAATIKQGPSSRNTASKTRMPSGAITSCSARGTSRSFWLRCVPPRTRRANNSSPTAIAQSSIAAPPIRIKSSTIPTRRGNENSPNTRGILVRRSLELIRDQSTLNVRILTRSPLARADFDLFQQLRQAPGVRHEPAHPAQRSGQSL